MKHFKHKKRYAPGPNERLTKFKKQRELLDKILTGYPNIDNSLPLTDLDWLISEFDKTDEGSYLKTHCSRQYYEAIQRIRDNWQKGFLNSAINTRRNKHNY